MFPFRFSPSVWWVKWTESTDIVNIWASIIHWNTLRELETCLILPLIYPSFIHQRALKDLWTLHYSQTYIYISYIYILATASEVK